MSEIERKRAYGRQGCPKATTKAINRAFCWSRLLVTPTTVLCICIYGPHAHAGYCIGHILYARARWIYRVYSNSSRTSNSSRPRIVAAHSASAKNKSRPRIVAAVNYIHSAMSYGGHARSYTYVRTQLLRVRARARYWRAVVVAALE